MSFSMVSRNPLDHVAMWIVCHYRALHDEIMEKHQNEYLRFLFAKAGMPLP